MIIVGAKDALSSTTIVLSATGTTGTTPKVLNIGNPPVSPGRDLGLERQWSMN